MDIFGIIIVLVGAIIVFRIFTALIIDPVHDFEKSLKQDRSDELEEDNNKKH